nr:hypothetical protein CFP56_25918 [Quercus suber]
MCARNQATTTGERTNSGNSPLLDCQGPVRSCMWVAGLASGETMWKTSMGTTNGIKWQSQLYVAYPHVDIKCQSGCTHALRNQNDRQDELFHPYLGTIKGTVRKTKGTTRLVGTSVMRHADPDHDGVREAIQSSFRVTIPKESSAQTLPSKVTGYTPPSKTSQGSTEQSPGLLEKTRIRNRLAMEANDDDETQALAVHSTNDDRNAVFCGGSVDCPEQAAHDSRVNGSVRSSENHGSISKGHETAFESRALLLSRETLRGFRALDWSVQPASVRIVVCFAPILLTKAEAKHRSSASDEITRPHCVFSQPYPNGETMAKDGEIRRLTTDRFQVMGSSVAKREATNVVNHINEKRPELV